ncbi:cobalamin biosynthesis protein CbiX [Escherichia coli]|nr:cobalamin biosynthesis protein CbiX [Escherichia coli]ELK6478217.1 cobalamin biosynthesis protein CbiX [Escherichia coli]
MKSCFDTDKAFHMSFDEVTFNADRIRSKLELLSEELMPRCGLVYELYQRRLSAAIDNFVATLPTEQHLLVLELAREEFDYLSAEEIAEEIRRDSERGYCCHGFERNCCPLGCGDLGDDCCDAADLMEEPCQRQDYWPFFAIFNVRYWSLMLSAFRHFIITDWRGVFCQHSRFAFFL